MQCESMNACSVARHRPKRAVLGSRVQCCGTQARGYSRDSGLVRDVVEGLKWLSELEDAGAGVGVECSNNIGGMEVQAEFPRLSQ